MLTTQAMTKKYGVTARALRFYHSQELLCPTTDTGRRLFTSTDEKALELILLGQRLGLTLNQIYKYLIDGRTKLAIPAPTLERLKKKAEADFGEVIDRLDTIRMTLPNVVDGVVTYEGAS